MARLPSPVLTSPSDRGPIVHPQLWEVVAERLRDDILSGALPEGTKLAERDLAARYGVSRGPVREALREMTRLGLAEDLPRRGTYVCVPSEADLEEVYFSRDVIEAAAARLAIRRGHPDELVALRKLLPDMEAAYQAGDYTTAWALDLDFHRAIVLLGGNKRLLGMFEQLATETIHLLRTGHERRQPIGWVPPATWEQDRIHRDIVEALIARDEARATAAFELHFGYTEERPYDVASLR
jgi:DNA-binding GntR family transcriptional regulator